jgi:hypothetical protein
MSDHYEMLSEILRGVCGECGRDFDLCGLTLCAVPVLVPYPEPRQIMLRVLCTDCARTIEPPAVMNRWAHLWPWGRYP